MNQEISKLIADLSAQLGVASDYFWPIFVRQQVVISYINLLTSVISVLITLIIFKKGIKHWDTRNEGRTILIVLTMFAFSLISIVSILDVAPNAISKLLNPEYYALQNLTGMFIK